MTEDGKPLLAVIGTHSRGTNAAERKVVIESMSHTVVYRDAA
jgi:hypothetical protein